MKKMMMRGKQRGQKGRKMMRPQMGIQEGRHKGQVVRVRRTQQGKRRWKYRRERLPARGLIDLRGPYLGKLTY